MSQSTNGNNVHCALGSLRGAQHHHHDRLPHDRGFAPTHACLRSAAVSCLPGLSYLTEEFIEPLFGCVEICNANYRLLQGLCVRSARCDHLGHNDDDDDDDDNDNDDDNDDDDGPGRCRRLCRR
ncbi:hypothetical protein AB5N19_13035 [Seiridium cardinale]